MLTPHRRHTMWFDVGSDDLASLPVDVHPLPKTGKRIVNIGLRDDHISRALEMHGQGDGNRCAGAVCVKNHQHLFSHSVYYAEWTDSRLYIVHKRDRRNFPVACITYRHNAGSLAKLFDDKTGSGIREIREAIRRAGGVLNIKLEAVGPKLRSSGPSGKRASGERAAALLEARKGKAIKVQIEPEDSQSSTKGATKGRKAIPRGTMRRIFRSKGR